jgi:hypothetical protein
VSVICSAPHKIITPTEIEDVQKKLQSLLVNSKLKSIATYGIVSKQAIVQAYAKTARAISGIDQESRVSFICEHGNVQLKQSTHLSEELIEDLLVAKRDVSECDVCLKVKKPDYLGDSRWAFQRDGHPIDAKMDDTIWLMDFRERRVDLKPGDSLKAKLRAELCFDSDGSALPPRYSVVKVYEIISGNDDSHKMLFQN